MISVASDIVVPPVSAALARSAVMALVASSTLLTPATSWAAEYLNARFGYAVTYPAERLVPEREADNGDGRAFHARKGSARMSVWGSYRADEREQTSAGIAELYLADCDPAKITYRVTKPELVAFSCLTPEGRILYQKTIVRGDTLRSVRFDYPWAERASWAPVVKAVADSLRVTSPR